MVKYYTRACNFYYGPVSAEKVKNHLYLHGNNLISFDEIEILTRKNTKELVLKKLTKLDTKLKKSYLI